MGGDRTRRLQARGARGCRRQPARPGTRHQGGERPPGRGRRGGGSRRSRRPVPGRQSCVQRRQRIGAQRRRRRGDGRLDHGRRSTERAPSAPCRRSQIRSSSPKPCSGTKQCYAWGKARCVSPLSAALRGRAWRSAAGAAPRTTPSDASRSTAEEPWPRPLPLGAWRALRPDASATHVFQGADSTPIVGLARCRPPATANALRV